MESEGSHMEKISSLTYTFIAYFLLAVVLANPQIAYAAFNSNHLDFQYVYVDGTVDHDDSVILTGVFHNKSSARLGDFTSAYIQLTLPTVSGGQLNDDTSFYQLDATTTQQYRVNLESKLRSLAGGQSVSLPIAKFDQVRPHESGGLVFDIGIVRLVVSGGIVVNPDGSFSTSISFIPAKTLPVFFTVSCKLNPSELRDGIASPTASGPTILSSFTPPNGCTLNKLADAMGYDHFNWVQIITHYDGVLYFWYLFPVHNTTSIPPYIDSTPFLDPPDGGYRRAEWSTTTADSLDYYWDEKLGYEPGYYLYDDDITQFGQYLNFWDTPGSASIDKPDEYMSFTTSLVGVVGGNAWVPIYTFTWKSNYNKDSGSGGVLRNIDAIEGGDGGVYDIQILEDPLAVSPEVKAFWEKHGYFDSIPSNVLIKILPGNKNRCIKINDKGVIPVAILGTNELDVTQINPDSLFFGGLRPAIKNIQERQCSYEDVNSDTIYDLLCKFEDSRNDWHSADNQVMLKGKLLDDTNIVGIGDVCGIASDYQQP